MTVSNATQPASSVDQTAARFYVSGKAFSFHRQYSKIYAARFQAVKPRLINAVTNVWNATVSEEALLPKIPIRSLNNLVTNERCVIIGIVYKEMRKKPSVLRELAASETVHSPTKNQTKNSSDSSKLFSADDSVYLEDDMQRILLIIDADNSKLSLAPTNLITGVPVALMGFEPESEPGSFRVEDVMFLEPQPDLPIVARPYRAAAADGGVDPSQCMQFRSSGPWLALVSGLEFVGTGKPGKVGHAMALQLLADWLRCAGDWTDNAAPTQSLGIVRLMILGDSIYAPSSGFTHGSLTQQARYLTRNTEADSVTAMTRLDSWLSTLPLGPGTNSETTNGFPVDLLPGPSDPTSPLLPQQPVHAAAFPLATSRHFGPSTDQPHQNALCGRTNPFLCQLFGRTVLATSGQGVNDLLYYTDIEDPCDRMEATLVWGHLAPSCPDTLPGYPLSGTDLLLLSADQQTPGASASADYPDIYVAGCQPGQEPRWRRASLRWRDRRRSADGGALLVSVPRFSVSRSLVLVHLDTLECRVVRFDTSALDNLDE